jgi:hypothetical protein
LEKDLDKTIILRSGNFENFSDILEEKFNWDPLTANSVWSFGPFNIGPNILVDYSLTSESEK